MFTQIDQNLWYDETDLFMPGGMHFRCRMTIIRLQNGELLLHSPITIDKNLASKIDELGKVAHIVAPNCLHHLFLPDCMKRYPEARVYGAPGLAKKRKDIQFDEVLSSTAPEAWRDDIEQFAIEGAPKVNEVVFYHRATKTLIVTDLIFNIHETKGWLSPLVLRWVARAYKKPAQSRLWRMFFKDKQAAAQSIHRILQWDFERLVMAHGRIVERDGHATFQQANAWLLKGRKLLQSAAG